ncbi:PAS domain S-box protein [Pontibacter silvestris]|uniref:histidine kinase n=1 Tax=Pontibacter silvestris TaxID=2305183 RepID=A0ABW4X3G0_9BACT|nr:PAS domain S-box protein [Pontibacter silvestris]MCC9138321.1 PAS domain S-box protein [Pontibacter silvestris]
MTTFEETKKLLEHSTFYYIIVTNMEGKYSYVSNSYKESFGRIHGPIEGQSYEITMHPDDTKVCEEVSVKCFNNPDKVFPATIRKHDGKGGYVFTQWEYKAMFDENNQPSGIFCLGFDITDYMSYHDQLKDVQSLLDQKEKVLKEIAHTQSHVIRRPLANIMGLSMILAKMEIDQNLKNVCDMIIESSRQLDNVIKATADKTYN